MATPKKKEEKKANPVKRQAPKAHAVGRRKSSVARVFLRRGKGKLAVNGLDHTRYFDTETTQSAAMYPFQIVPILSSYDVDANVTGGGKNAQADAIKLGISRAVLQFDEALRPILRKNGLLTVDSRVKERKKYGQKGARAKFQFVKR